MSSCIPVRIGVAQGQGQTGMGGIHRWPRAGLGWRLREKALGALFQSSLSFPLRKMGTKTWIQHGLECPGGKWRARQQSGYPGEPRDQRECAGRERRRGFWIPLALLELMSQPGDRALDLGSCISQEVGNSFFSTIPAFPGPPCSFSSEELRFGTLVPPFPVENPAA